MTRRRGSVGVQPPEPRVYSRARMASGGWWHSRKQTYPTSTGSPPRTITLDDYVGHYRLVDSGDKGDISITRVGAKLIDTWANGEAIELFPGKYDTFFSREDGWVERFLRDKSGKVTGILYTHTDGELEAKRVP